MEAWDDEGVDVRRLTDRIINGILHHPAQRKLGEDGARDGREIMFRSVEEWWNSLSDEGKDEYRRKLSRDGVERGENHKEGVHDSGHGCGKPLGMHKNFAKGGTMEDRIATAAAGAIVEGVTGGISSFVGTQTGGAVNLPTFDQPSGGSGGRRDDSGGDVGGFLGKVASSFLGGAFGGDEKETRTSSRRDDDGSYTESRTEYGRSGDRHGEAQYSETQHGDGGRSSEYRRYEQDDGGRGSSGYEERTESRRTHGGGSSYEERTESRYESTSESYGDSQGRRQESYGDSQRGDYSSGGYGRDESSYGRSGGYGGGGDSGYGREERSSGYGRDDGGYGRRRSGEDDRDDDRRVDDEDQRRPGYGY